VHEGDQVLQSQGGQPAADVVLHGLDVVDRHGLDLRELRDRVRVEVRDDPAQPRGLLAAQGRQARQHRPLGEVDEPLHLHVHAVAVEGGLGEVVDQGRDHGLVAAVEGPQRDGRDGGGERRAP
jgi:hypothetical protein